LVRASSKQFSRVVWQKIQQRHFHDMVKQYQRYQADWYAKEDKSHRGVTKVMIDMSWYEV